MELRLYYEFVSAGMAAFIIKWILEGELKKDKAAALLSDILLRAPTHDPSNFIVQMD